jgi:hypothetical protein
MPKSPERTAPRPPAETPTVCDGFRPQPRNEVMPTPDTTGSSMADRDGGGERDGRHHRTAWVRVERAQTRRRRDLLSPKTPAATNRRKSTDEGARSTGVRNRASSCPPPRPSSPRSLSGPRIARIPPSVESTRRTDAGRRRPTRRRSGRVRTVPEFRYEVATRDIVIGLSRPPRTNLRSAVPRRVDRSVRETSRPSDFGGGRSVFVMPTTFGRRSPATREAVTSLRPTKSSRGGDANADRIRPTLGDVYRIQAKCTVFWRGVSGAQPLG